MQKMNSNETESLIERYKGAPDLDGFMGFACDAAPKKPQTLAQHLKHYHKGKMPKGDCSWLKQYKKDHPDWQKEAEKFGGDKPKVTKKETAVDTVQKTRIGKKSDKSIEEEINAAVKRVAGQFWVDTGITHGAESRMEADRKMLAALLADPPDIAEAMKNASLNAYTPSVHALMNGLSRNYGHIDIGRRAIENAIKNATDEELEKEYAGANSFDAVKKMAEAEIAARKSKGKGGKD